jgi:microcystin-dependent protein
VRARARRGNAPPISEAGSPRSGPNNRANRPSRYQRFRSSLSSQTSLQQETGWETSMGQPYVGEIRMFAGNFAPAGWMLCAGQLLPISENEVLFQLIGTTYGGDGQETFGLPNLQSRVPIHMGTSAGITYQQGEAAGVEDVTLTTNQIPSHNHAVQVATSAGDRNTPAADTIVSTEGESVTNRAPVYAAYANVNQIQLAGQTVGSAGSSQPHSNIQPILAINFIISLFGIFPSQT